MARARAAASEPHANDAVETIGASGGNAVDAVLGGFLATAAVRPGTLLGPVYVVVGGVGVGARVFDGRVCQPGSKAPRPRGHRQDEAIPPAARAAAPRSLATLALVHAYGAGRPMSALAKPAIAAAKKRDAPERAALLDAVARQGALALLGSEALRALRGAPNVIAFHLAWQEGGHLHAQLELCALGSVAQIVSRNGDAPEAPHLWKLPGAARKGSADSTSHRSPRACRVSRAGLATSATHSRTSTRAVTSTATSSRATSSSMRRGS